MNKIQRGIALCSCLACLCTLAGCELEAASKAKASETEHVPQKKIFKPGEHCFATYYWFYRNEGYSEFQKQIKIPEGYELTDTEITTDGYGSSEGIIYWFTNTKTVEATEAKNTRGQWEYCYAGQVVEDEVLLVLGQ